MNEAFSYSSKHLQLPAPPSPPHPVAPPLLPPRPSPPVPPSSHAPYLDSSFSSGGESIGTDSDTQVLESRQVDDPNAPGGKRGKRLSKFALRSSCITITVTSP